MYSYGNSSLIQGQTKLSPIRATSLGDEGNGWSPTVMGVRPGVPGDSGSAFVNAKGRAIGVLSTISIAPVPASNGVGDLAPPGYPTSLTTDFIGPVR